MKEFEQTRIEELQLRTAFNHGLPDVALAELGAHGIHGLPTEGWWLKK